MLASVGIAAGESSELLAPVTVPTVAPGSELSVDIRPVDGEREMRLMVARGPVGAELDRSETGWTLRWDAPERLSAVTRLVLLAVDVKDPMQRQRVELEFATDDGRDPDLTASDAHETVPQSTPSLVPDSKPAQVEADMAAGQTNRKPLALPVLPRQTLETGRIFSLWFQVDGAQDDEQVTVEADDAPDGLELRQQVGGWQIVEWQPGPDQTGLHDLELLATSQDDPMRQARGHLLLTVTPSNMSAAVEQRPSTPDLASAPLTAPEYEPLPEPGPPEAPPLDEPSVQAASVNELAVAPSLNAMSDIIVSAGRTVQFRVTPQIPFEQPSVVQIDRLPRNASFDQNPDGSRTFHWLTSDRDQGEHRFRFTAMNATDSTLRDQQEVTIIVGDPTRGKTLPSQ